MSTAYNCMAVYAYTFSSLSLEPIETVNMENSVATNTTSILVPSSLNAKPVIGCGA